MPKPQFKPGDLVELKSGGPVMTIEKPNFDIYEVWEGTYSCSWFAGDKHQHNRFAQAALRPAKADES
jgi:uncharacterized protein YodC (DUF2158 family)